MDEVGSTLILLTVLIILFLGLFKIGDIFTHSMEQSDCEKRYDVYQCEQVWKPIYQNSVKTHKE